MVAGVPWWECSCLPSDATHSEVIHIRETVQAVQPFVMFSTLYPGRYHYESELPDDMLAAQPYVAHGSVHVAGKHISVEVSPEHIQLLKHANFRFHDSGGLEVFSGLDAKHPYGDRTDYVADMAEILGIERGGHLEVLHRTMQPLLQVFLQHAELRAGRFVQYPAGHGRWHRTWDCPRAH